MSDIFLTKYFNCNTTYNENNIRNILDNKFGMNSVKRKSLEEAKYLIESFKNYEEIFEASSSHLYSLGAIEDNDDYDDYVSSEVYEKLENLDDLEDYLYESVADTIKDAKYKYKKKEKSIDRAVADKIRKMNDEIKDDIREKYVERVPFKLSKIIKTGIAVGAAWAINPVIAAIGAVVAFATSKAANQREKDRLISEIREERTIVEEKIKDADSNADKEEKYQLMRVKISLDRAEKRLLME